MMNKKMKTEAEQDDFDRVKAYLLECTHVSNDSPAIKAALLAIDKEKLRVERDRKLQLKFSKGKTSSSTNTLVPPTATNLEDSVVVVDESDPTRTPPSSVDEGIDEIMEWQDIEGKGKDDNDSNTSFLGMNMAKTVVDAISEHKAKARTPVAAAAMALHAALRSDVLGFSCTGVPEDKCTTNTGFAAPVRELPKSQFLPMQWDAKSNIIALRYRKTGTGALVLEVEKKEDSRVTVHLRPANTKEPASQTLDFALIDHVNLDSWNAASKTGAAVSPSLHYKSLAVLLTNFCRTFDLGSIKDGVVNETSSSVPYVDHTAVSGDTGKQAAYVAQTYGVPPLPVEAPKGASSPEGPNWSHEVPSTLGEAFPSAGVAQRDGDFAGDLAPSGFRDPLFLPEQRGRMGGNLMGPNHPAFQGGSEMSGPNGFPMGGPGSMQPRFDPMYPMGIDPNGGSSTGRRSKVPSRRGEPNPDHLAPPDAFGANMFS